MSESKHMTAWAYADAKDSDRWLGWCETRDECIAEARADLGSATAFWVDKSYRVDACSYMPDADSIIEQTSMLICDNTSADDDMLDTVSKEARAELDALLQAWGEKHLSANWFELAGEPERIEGLAPDDT